MLKQRLLKEADEKYQKFSSSLIPNVDNVLGVRLPLLRKIAKEIYKSDWRTFLVQNDFEYMEEIMLQGMVIGLVKGTPQEILELVKSFVPKIDNWAVCDTFCGGLKFAQDNRKLVWEFLQPYFESEKEYDIRFGAVMLLSHYLVEDYVDDALKILERLRHEGYYAKMAIAWAVSIFYTKFPEKTHKFLEKADMDDWTYNKSIQKIVESYRVDNQTKEILKKMKRKVKA